MAKKLLTGADLNNQRLINLGAPASATDATTKTYVDNLVAGLSYKDEVKAATTAALPAVTYANGTAGVGATLTADANGAMAAVDGESSPSANDRYLIKNQASSLQNGIYVVTQVGTGGTPFILTRATDSDTSAELNNATVYVTTGTVNSGREYTQTTANPTVGTNDIVFVQKSTGSTYTAGSGLGESPAGTFNVNVDNSTVEINADTLRVKDGGITEAKLSFDPATQAELDAHLNDTSDAHDASAISYAGGTGISATDVEAAIDELATEKVDTTRTITAGNGLTGGGDLSANRTIDVAATNSSITVAADGISVTKPYDFYSETSPNNATWTVTHNLGTRDVLVQIYDTGTFETVEADVVRTSTTVVTITFPSAPALGLYKVLVIKVA